MNEVGKMNLEKNSGIEKVNLEKNSGTEKVNFGYNSEAEKVNLMSLITLGKIRLLLLVYCIVGTFMAMAANGEEQETRIAVVSFFFALLVIVHVIKSFKDD